MSRVGYVLKKFPRLSETFVLTELLALEELGVPLVIYSLRAPDDPRFHPELGKLRAEIRYVQAGPLSEALARLGRAEPDAARRSQRVALALRFLTDPALLVGSQPPAALAEEASFAIRVAELAQADGVAHLHAHFATVAARVAATAAELAGVTFSLTGHAKDIYRATVDFRVLDHLARSAKAFVTVCDSNVRWLRQKLSPDGFAHVRRVYNGIDLDAFAVRRAGGPAGGETPVLLAIGRLVKKKGFHVLLDAAAELRTRGVRFEVRIVGDGPDRSLLERQAAELELRDRVVFRGAQPSTAIRDELATATLFCLPCVTDEDGNQDALPTVLIEAMAAGVPCVSTRIGGVPEILADGRAGALVESGDARALANAIGELLLDPSRRARLVAEAAAHVRAHFDRRGAARSLRAIHVGDGESGAVEPERDGAASGASA